VKTWSKLPTFWYAQQPDVIPSFTGGAEAGRSQAGLRVLLALAAADRPASSYAVIASLTDLEEWTDLSRSMVLAGIRRAVVAGLITYEPGKQRAKSKFSLINPSESAGGWAKLPLEQVREGTCRIPHRGDVALTALKIYLILIAARSNDNCVVSLRHETIRSKTGCQTRHLRAAISLLANAGLIHVINDFDLDEPTSMKASQYRVQRYLIKGRLDAPRQWNDVVADDATIPAQGAK